MPLTTVEHWLWELGFYIFLCLFIVYRVLLPFVVCWSIGLTLLTAGFGCVLHASASPSTGTQHTIDHLPPTYFDSAALFHGNCTSIPCMIDAGTASSYELEATINESARLYRWPTINRDHTIIIQYRNLFTLRALVMGDLQQLNMSGLPMADILANGNNTKEVNQVEKLLLDLHDYASACAMLQLILPDYLDKIGEGFRLVTSELLDEERIRHQSGSWSDWSIALDKSNKAMFVKDSDLDPMIKLMQAGENDVAVMISVLQQPDLCMENFTTTLTAAWTAAKETQDHSTESEQEADEAEAMAITEAEARYAAAVAKATKDREEEIAAARSARARAIGLASSARKKALDDLDAAQRWVASNR